MAADLIVYHIFMKGTPDTQIEMDGKERKMLNEVNNNLTNEDITEYKQNLIDYANYEENDEYELDIKETIKNAIMEFFGCLNGRDVDYVIHNNETIWFTGGMSWGDNPTEAFTQFENFMYIPERIRKIGGFE